MFQILYSLQGEGTAEMSCSKGFRAPKDHIVVGSLEDAARYAEHHLSACLGYIQSWQPMPKADAEITMGNMGDVYEGLTVSSSFTVSVSSSCCASVFFRVCVF